MIKFEYVLSAPAYIGSFDKGTLANPNFVTALHGYNQYAKQQRPEDTDYSILFNAFTEETFNDHLIKYNKYGAQDKLYVDSGGLQIITMGAKIDDEMKKKIWTRQAKSQGYCMCFDEMPLHIDGDSSKRGNTNCRILIDDKIEDAGKITGAGINEQIEVFKSLGSEAKVMAIGQGQDLETYQRYLNGVVDNIDPKNFDTIQGVSLSLACCGTKPFNSIDIFNTIKHLDIPDEFKKHVHLLGAGSIRKILPAVLLYRSGFLDKFTLSFDSSTHSSSFDNGQFFYYDGNSCTTLGTGKVRNDTIDKVYYTKIYEPNKVLFDCMGLDTYEKFMQCTIYTEDPKLKGGKPGDFKAYDKLNSVMFPLVKFMYIHAQIMDFNKLIRDVVANKISIDKLSTSDDMLKVWHMLEHVKDDATYKEFAKKTKRYFMSTQPNIKKYSSYDEFYLKEKAFGELF